MSILDGVQPAGWTALSDEQKARAAALAIAFRYAGPEVKNGIDQVDAAVFILDGAESYALHRRIMNLPDEEELPEVTGWAGGMTLYAGREGELS